MPRAGVETDSAGNVYVAGDFFDSVQADQAGSSAGRLTSNGTNDVFVAKYNSSGDLLWATSFGSDGYDYAWGLALDDSDNVIVTGNFNGTVDFAPSMTDPLGLDTLTSAGGYDGFILKLDANGEFQWVRQMMGDDFDRVFSVDVDRANDIYIGTQSYSSTVTYDGLPPQMGSGVRHAGLAKIDAGGTFQWARSFHNDDVVPHVLPVVDDRASDPADWTVKAVGEFTNQLTMDADVLVSRGDKDAFLVAVDAATGQATLAATSFGGPYIDRALAIGIGASGEIYVSGYFQQQTDFDLAASHADGSDLRESSGPNDLFVLRLQDDLSYDTVTTFGGSGFEGVPPNSLAVTPAGEVYVSGHFEAAMQFGDYALVSSGETTPMSSPLTLISTSVGPTVSEVAARPGVICWDLEIGTGLANWLAMRSIAPRASRSTVRNLYVTGSFKQTADFSTGDRLTSNGD
ncbi:MAG: hypothetical protein R3C28_13740 [Pirellulaceae bacterium]